MLRCILALFFLLIFVAGQPSFCRGAPPQGIGDVAWKQITAIEREKSTVTPIQRKLDSHFVHELKSRRGQLPAILATIPSSVRFEQDGRTLVDINANVTEELLRQIQQAGGTVIRSEPRFHAVRAQIPLDALETLAAFTNVAFIKQAARCRLFTGSVESQGDISHGADTARANFSVDGSGIKVGVLSDSVLNLSTSQSTGDLPANVVVLPGQSGTNISGNTGEGTAMLEIVNDLAPGAQLYFATADASEAGFAQNILSLRSNGCNIIVDDVGYYDEPVFQDGIVAQAVNSVTADGALYFSAAGNGGRRDAGTSATWEGDFLDGGNVAGSTVAKSGETGVFHSFGKNNYDVVQGLNRSDVFQVSLFWSDPWGASTNDYDLFVLTSSGSSIYDYSAGPSTGTQNPFEICNAKNNCRVVVVKFSGASRFLHVELETDGYGTLSVSTPGNLRGHAAATNAFAVAAVDVHDAYPNLFNAANTNEYFSSDGPRKMFYEADGTPVTPNNFTNNGGAIRLKPDISAADGVSNSVSGFNPFFGTSAAAPHAAAIAALLWSFRPSLTTAQMREILTSTAIDIDAPGWDRNAGYGIVMPGAAIQSLLATNPPPAANFSASVTSGVAPLAVVFNNLSSGATNYLWNFGDGNFSAAVSPTNIYNSQGNYTVTLTASGPGGWTTLAQSNYIILSNSPPVLAPIANRTIHAGTTLAITNSATDPDIPTDTLTFALTNSPASATMGSSSGVFVWTPDETFANTTNNFTVRVTDNGIPPLSDEKSFSVTVVPPPAFLASPPPLIANGAVTISWSAISGQTYRVQFTDDLRKTNWLDLPPDVTATNFAASATDLIGTNVSRFYRVLPLPVF